MYNHMFRRMHEAENVIGQIDKDNSIGQWAIVDARPAAIRECADILAAKGAMFAGGPKDADNIKNYEAPLDAISCALMVLAMRIARWSGRRLDGTRAIATPHLSDDWCSYCWKVTLTGGADRIPPVDLRVMAPKVTGWRPAVQSALLHLMGQMVHYRSLHDEQQLNDNTTRNITHELMLYAVRFGPFPRHVATNGYVAMHGDAAEFVLVKPLQNFVQAVNDAKRKSG